MSWGADQGHDRVVSLRALAHPVRLQMLSLLTGAPMSAAEVARELGLTHANASYHLRQLLAAGQLVEAGEETIRGGRAKRYRYDVDAPGATASGPGERATYYRLLADELLRRSASNDPHARQTSTDAELWVAPDDWARALDLVKEAMAQLHRVALPPRAPGAAHVSVSLAMFAMADPSDDQPAP
jgi:DNA-binding transcriptional ArsR family regulator